MEKQVIQYIRDKKNNPKGVMVAFTEGEQIYIGWSLCSKYDKYDKHKGFDIAVGRAYKNVNKKNIEVAHSAFAAFERFCFKVGNKKKEFKLPKWAI